MTISELKRKSNKFVASLDATIERIVNYNEDLEQLNKDQLKASQLANGQNITPPYSNPYAHWKSITYPASFGDGKVNLFLTGALYQNMEIKAKGKSYQILSLVPYAAKLVNKYTNLIFGIAPSNQDKAKAITTKLLANEYRAKVIS